MNQEATADSAETQRLLKAAAEGAPHAFEQLLERHRPELHTFIELRLEPRLRARVEMEDVAQDVLVEALRRLPDFLRRRPMGFRQWLCKTAYERLLMLRRRHVFAAGRTVYREVALPDPSSLVLAQRLFAPGATPSQQLAQKELAQRVQKALSQLSAEDRDVLLMRNTEGMSYKDIAGILGIEPAAARKRHGRALIHLHRLLSGADSGELL